ncbi:MAG: GTPase Era [Bacteroidetes bacterium]|jgi:GTPase|uniref:GTPase Era n=1 Tax=unclassified Phnomibacter TaxID=2836226 RepID=UPI002FDD0902|nr:GTPase Era [Bacteroidota bacterium]MCC6760005.1 GTPase Era [Chitinophagaceae bacterium]
MNFQSGFVSILGKPNAGKSTLLNALVGEKMAIVSPKVQTTRHRIKAFLNGDNFQIIFSDTPGIIEPQYKLHERMMKQVRNAMEDADAGLLVYDVGELQDEEAHAFFQQLKLKVPAILLVNKIDSVKESVWKKTVSYFTESGAYKAVIPISALKGTGIPELQKTLLQFIPQGDPFYSTEDLSDLPTRFFVGEIVREKIFDLYHQEVPYHSTVLVQEFTEKSTLIKIRADIIVQREMQKIILIGDKGSMIKKLGTAARIDIEQFLGQKVFLELFVKVRPKWRDQDVFLREYGYE